MLTYLFKDTGSGGGGCPALYDAPRAVPGYGVQGKVLRLKDDTRPGFVVYGLPLTVDERAGLRDVAGDEDAVWVPADALYTQAIADTEPEAWEPPAWAVAVWVPDNVLDPDRVLARA